MKGKILTGLMSLVMVFFIPGAHADVDAIVPGPDCEMQPNGSCVWDFDFGSPTLRDGWCAFIVNACPATRFGDAMLVSPSGVGEFVWFLNHQNTNNSTAHAEATLSYDAALSSAVWVQVSIISSACSIRISGPQVLLTGKGTMNLGPVSTPLGCNGGDHIGVGVKAGINSSANIGTVVLKLQSATLSWM